MTREWLFVIPESSEGEEAQWRLAAERVERDPEARMISDEEATAFWAAAWLLRHGNQSVVDLTCRTLHMKPLSHGRRSHRSTVLQILRYWRNPVGQNVLRTLPKCVSLGGRPDVSSPPEERTLDSLEEHCRSGMNPMWAIYLLRVDDQADQIQQLIERLGEPHSQRYQYWLNTARLTLRQVVYQTPLTEVVREKRQRRYAEVLKHRLQEQDALVRSLHEDLRKMEERRHTWGLRAKSAESEVPQLLETVRAEITTARSDLERRNLVREQELESLTARHQDRIFEAKRELSLKRRECAVALAQHGLQAGAAVLAGLRVHVRGDEANRSGLRLVVESLGGRWADGEADLTILLGSRPVAGAFTTEQTGLAGFEAVLNRQVLPTLSALRQHSPTRAD